MTIGVIFRPEANIHVQWGNEEYIPQEISPPVEMSMFRRVTLDDDKVPREVKEDSDPDHSMYFYRQGDCIGRVHGDEMEDLKAELDTRLSE